MNRILSKKVFMAPGPEVSEGSGVSSVLQNLSDFNFSLLNIQTINDLKMPQLNEDTKDNHVTFFTELNIASEEHKNIVTSDTGYKWVFIKSHKNCNRRIGLRYPASLKNDIHIDMIEEDYMIDKSRKQKDKSVVQYMIFKLSLFQMTKKVMLVYRVPDCEFEFTKKLFDKIEANNLHLCVGDFNLDWRKPSLRKKIAPLTKLKQSVKKPTRIGVSCNNKETATIIDHIWAKFSEKRKLDIKEPFETAISDHMVVPATIDCKMPRVRLQVPVITDNFRRYFPKNVDWEKFPFSMSPDNIELLNSDQIYASVQDELLRGCEKMNITYRKDRKFKTEFRFSMSKDTRVMKRHMHNLRWLYRRTKFRIDEAEAGGADDEVVMNLKIQYEKEFTEYKRVRNKYSKMAKKDSREFFDKKSNCKIKDIKELWWLVNRSKEKVENDVEKLQDPMFHPDEMAKFFVKRANLCDNIDKSPIDNFEPFDGVELTNIDYKISDSDIDEAMKYKPAPDPDPDSLSMMIWSKMYEKNENFRAIIRKLFKLSLERDQKIPGLSKHDVKLYLKVDNPKRQKDIRPVASLPSVPKRMLRILVNKIKSKNKNLFYENNDFAAPNRGTQALVLATYDDLHTSYYSKNGRHDPKRTTVLRCYDMSNAYNTFDRKKLIGNLRIGGPAREVLCNAIKDQSSFAVRTKEYRSEYYQLMTGGPQGQCSTGELFATLARNIQAPDVSGFSAEEVKIIRRHFVDDINDICDALTTDLAVVESKIEKRIKDDCDDAGLMLNEEKTERMVISMNTRIPKKVVKLVGTKLNSRLNADDEIDSIISKTSWIINSLGKCPTIPRAKRIFMASNMIHSKLGNLVFVSAYSSEYALEQFSNKINNTFKRAANLPLDIPHKVIENYLYGCEFKDYVKIRLLREAYKLQDEEIRLFDSIQQVRGKLRVKRNCRTGPFVNKFMEIHNSDFDPKLFTKNKKSNKKQSFQTLLTFKSKI